MHLLVLRFLGEGKFKLWSLNIKFLVHWKTFLCWMEIAFTPSYGEWDGRGANDGGKGGHKQGKTIFSQGSSLLFSFQVTAERNNPLANDNPQLSKCIRQIDLVWGHHILFTFPKLPPISADLRDQTDPTGDWLSILKKFLTIDSMVKGQNVEFNGSEI